MADTQLQIDENHRLRASGLNWMLERTVDKVSRKTGESRQEWEIIGYYSDLGAACRQQFRDSLFRLGVCNTVEDMLKRMGEIEKCLTNAVATSQPATPPMCLHCANPQLHEAAGILA